MLWKWFFHKILTCSVTVTLHIIPQSNVCSLWISSFVCTALSVLTGPRQIIPLLKFN